MLDGMPNEYRIIYTINENEENAIYCALKSVWKRNKKNYMRKLLRLKNSYCEK